MTKMTTIKVENSFSLNRSKIHASGESRTHWSLVGTGIDGVTQSFRKLPSSSTVHKLHLQTVLCGVSTASNLLGKSTDIQHLTALWFHKAGHAKSRMFNAEEQQTSWKCRWSRSLQGPKEFRLICLREVVPSFAVFYEFLWVTCNFLVTFRANFRSD